MQQTLCQYATRACEKLRGELQFCRRVGIFIRTSPHATGEIFYGNSASENLSVPTQDTRDVIEVAMRSLDIIWLEGRRYMKAGIMLDDFTPNGVSQLNLFDEDWPRPNSAKLMKVLDSITPTTSFVALFYALCPDFAPYFSLTTLDLCVNVPLLSLKKISLCPHPAPCNQPYI